MKYSPSQQRAINLRGSHLLLSAAAGSGKTFTLVERILALLCEGTDIDSMLIITFTRAAAADMKQKLIRELSERAEGSEWLSEQLRRVEFASIQTIDAFCADVVRGHFEAAGADPQFRVPDDVQYARLLERALDATLDAAYAEGGDDLDALHFGRGVRGVRELVLTLHRFAQNRPDPARWLEHALIELPDGDGALWFEELARHARRTLRAQLASMRCALTLCQLPGGPAAYADALRSDIEQLEAMLGAHEYDALSERIGAYSSMKLSAIRKADNVDETLKKRASEHRTAMKKAINALKDAMADRARLMLDMRENRPALRALHSLALRFSGALADVLGDGGFMGFGEVAHSALRALGQPSVAEAMRAHYSHIFVDEYQDVTDMQQALIDCIRRDDNVFMVGDVKQSIYRFRQAEPGLFLDAYRRFARGEGGTLIPLSQNFRSRPGILAFVNAVFERALSGEDSEIEYDDAARLYPGAAFEGVDPPVELIIGTVSDEVEPDEAFAALEAAEREGLLIAARIQSLMRNERFYDARNKVWRPYTYRDFAILTRSRSHMQALERTLSEAGIPVYADMNKGYLGAIEVQVARALLQLIENRRRDMALLAVLHSPIGNLQSEELARIRARHPAGDYRTAALNYMENCSDTTSVKLRALEDLLNRWRTLSGSLPLTELIDTALRESGYYAHVGRGPGGALKQANLDLLITYAADYESADSGGLSGFIRYVDEIEHGDGDMGTAHALGEGDDVVQLMTIHKSKGLEYPVVIGALLGKSIARRDKINELNLHRELGCGLALHDRALGSRRKTLAQRAILERSVTERLNEELRVLYVLLTRAVDRLILTGSVASPDEAAAGWQVLAQGGAAPKSFLDVLMVPIIGAPGGEALLSEGACEVNLGGARTHVRIVWEAPNRDALEPQAGDDQEQPPTDEQMRKALGALTWRYPHEDAVLRPLKLTVSGLVRDLMGPDVLPPLTRRPKFLTDEGLTGSERGTLTHQALMGLSLPPLRGLSGAPLRAELKNQLSALLQRGRLMASLNEGLIARFFEGEVGARLLASETVRREWPFTLRMPISDALGGDSDETLLVQGVIDCCFMEDGRWVLLDYKTDRSDDVQQLAERYAPQLALYARALATITKIPVSQSLLCLLQNGVCVDVSIRPVALP